LYLLSGCVYVAELPKAPVYTTLAGIAPETG
jgi:hypothetical protein